MRQIKQEMVTAVITPFPSPQMVPLIHCLDAKVTYIGMPNMKIWSHLKHQNQSQTI